MTTALAAGFAVFILVACVMYPLDCVKDQPWRAA